MKFQRIKYNTGQEIFKVRVEDGTGAILDNWVFMKDDFPNWIETMKRKFGVKISKDKTTDRDLDWAM